MELVKFDLPPDQVVGIHADAASVWHTQESFIIDFLALRHPPHPELDEAGDEVIVREFVVGARIRIPPTHVIELMKALEHELSKWETETGQRPPVNLADPGLG